MEAIRMSETFSVCAQCESVNKVDVNKGEAICGKCRSELPIHGAVVEGSDKTLPRLIEKSPLPVLVDFWAPWCGPCRAFAPTFAAMAGEQAGRVVFVKLNTDENSQLSAQFGIRSIPTLMLFKEGKELVRQSGAMPQEVFKNWLATQLS